MLAAPSHGFCFLASPKAASTAIQRAFAEHAQLLTPGPPSLKHLSAADFEADIAPLLARHGFARSSYVTTALVREPVDLTLSWYRYRTRRNLQGSARYTGDVTFDEYAERVVAGEGGFRPPREFLCDGDGTLLVERPYKYEHAEDLIAWMAERVGAPVEVGRANVSPQRDVEVAPSTRRLLEGFFARDLEIYAAAR